MPKFLGIWLRNTFVEQGSYNCYQYANKQSQTMQHDITVKNTHGAEILAENDNEVYKLLETKYWRKLISGII